jgi:hypothetical protein
MSKPQYLSKSDFQLATSCAQKLVYKKKKYNSSNDTDEYMMMLAQGGYIVGKMATILYPEGIEVAGSTTESLLKTKEYIQNCDSITLFEPTFEFNQRLSRIDIFVKNGNNIQLIEVKSASRDSSNPNNDSTKLKKYIQDSITKKGIFGAMLIYSTAKMTQKGTVANFENLEELVLKKDVSGRKIEVSEEILLTFENSSTDTVMVKLIYDKNVWRLKWQNMDDLE